MCCGTGKENFTLAAKYNPKIVLTRFFGLIDANLLLAGKGHYVSTDCIICDDKIKEGFEVEVCNFSDDNQLVGHICLKHEHDDLLIRKAATDQAIYALRERLRQVEGIDPNSIPITGRE